LPSQYQLYGFRIQSNTELAGLIACEDQRAADITIRQRPAVATSYPQQPESSRFFRTQVEGDGSIQMHAREVCRARIAPREGLIEWQPGSHRHPEAAQAYILGVGLSYCLLARGIEPTHGTALSVNGEAIALLGDSGYGKSTLAAGFVAAGYPMITDDMLILERSEERWYVQPGIARIKLFPQVRDALLPGLTGVPMNPFTTKEALYLEPRAVKPIPLKAIYLLPRIAAVAKQVRFRALSPRAAFFALIRNTFNDAVADSARLRRQFDFASKASTSIPVRAVRYPKSLERVPEVVRAIVADAANL
jgi:hypothetical protein